MLTILVVSIIGIYLNPLAAVFKESSELKKERIRQTSPYGHLPKWDIISIIIKSGADLRQEQLALQLIGEMERLWKESAIPAWVF